MPPRRKKRTPTPESSAGSREPRPAPKKGRPTKASQKDSGTVLRSTVRRVTPSPVVPQRSVEAELLEATRELTKSIGVLNKRSRIDSPVASGSREATAVGDQARLDGQGRRSDSRSSRRSSTRRSAARRRRVSTSGSRSRSSRRRRTSRSTAGSTSRIRSASRHRRTRSSSTSSSGRAASRRSRKSRRSRRRVQTSSSERSGSGYDTRGRRRTTTSRRRESRRRLDRNEVERIIEAVTLPKRPKNKGLTFLPHTFITRGDSRAKIQPGEATWPEYIVAIYKIMSHSEVDKEWIPHLRDHILQIAKLALTHDWETCRRWSEKVFYLISLGELGGWEDKEQIKDLKRDTADLGNRVKASVPQKQSGGGGGANDL